MSNSWYPVDYSLPGSSVHGFSRQEYWRGLPFSSPGHRPYPGIKPGSLALQADSLPIELQGKLCSINKMEQIILADYPPPTPHPQPHSFCFFKKVRAADLVKVLKGTALTNI